jgi:general secretion pathway protein F
MARYRYKAVDAGGEVATGELEAANEGEIVDRLRDQGLMPMQIAPAVGAAGGTQPSRAGARARTSLFTPKHVTSNQLIALTRDLATLLNAGLPLDRALEMMIGLAITPPVGALLQGVRDDVRGGKALSQALDARRDVFSRFYVNIVRAGEAGGALGLVLARLADTMERNRDLRESVKSALIYPTILIGVACVSVVILLIYVVPQFETTFAQAGKALPLATAIVVAVGTFFRNWWWATLVGIVLFVLWWRRHVRQPGCAGAGTSGCCACRWWATWCARSR